MTESTTSLQPILMRWLPFGILGGVVIGAVATLMIARWNAPERVQVDLTRMVPAASPVDGTERTSRLRIAVASMLTPSSNFEAYGGIIEYLGTRLERETDLIQRPSYAEVNALLADGGVDLAFVCSGAYIELRREADAELLVVPVVNGATTYCSLIVVRPGLEAQSLSELRGATFAFVDPLSNTGFYYPSWRIQQRGEEKDRFFSDTTYTYSHESSIEMVAAGVVDAAAVDNLVYEGLVRVRPEIRDSVRIIEQSEAFGIPPVVVRSDLDPTIKHALRDVLLTMDREPEGGAALEKLGFERFVEGHEEDYDTVEKMLHDLQVKAP